MVYLIFDVSRPVPAPALDPPAPRIGSLILSSTPAMGCATADGVDTGFTERMLAHLDTQLTPLEP